MIQGQLSGAYAQSLTPAASPASTSNANILSAGGYGSGQGDSYTPSYGGNGGQSAGDINQQMFSIVSLILQLLTALLPQLAGGGNGYATPGTGGYKPPAGGNTLGANAPAPLQKYGKEIENASAATGVPANVLGAMMWQESRGNPNSGGGIGEVGLMQMTPDTFQDLQAKHPELQGQDLSDPQTNIMASAFYMKDLMGQFGDIPTALRAYNSGPNGVDPSNLQALPAGTGDATYVDKVMDFSNRLANGAALPP